MPTWIVNHRKIFRLYSWTAAAQISSAAAAFSFLKLKGEKYGRYLYKK